MAPQTPFAGKRPIAGQVVRPPNPGDGVGRALRHVYGRDAILPKDWEAYLRSLDDLSKQ